MDKFASDKTTKIKFEDGEYVEIRDNISWGDFHKLREIQSKLNVQDSELELMDFFIKSWNFKENGKDIEISKENFKKLKLEIFSKIDSELVKRLGMSVELEKKSG